MLKKLESSGQIVEQTNIEELDAEIDRAVYDLFDLTDDEREVVEDYLEICSDLYTLQVGTRSGVVSMRERPRWYPRV